MKTGAQILVVDDEPQIRQTLRTILESAGYTVVTAESGEDAIRAFAQCRPDLVLMDLLIPGMGGIEVLQQIRAIDPHAGVIMLTGHATDALEVRARGLGVTDFLRKGTPLEALVRTMDRAMQGTAKVTEAPAAVTVLRETSVAAPPAPSILVVDDEPQIRRMISQFLTGRGYRVRVAQDGPTALALAAEELPKFVIVDMYMSGMNGLELTRKLRARQYRGGVLALTGSRDEELLQGMLDMGAVDVMGKPVDLERLELVVQVGCILTAPQSG